MKPLLVVAFSILICTPALSQTAQDHLRTGIEAYEKKIFETAINEFNLAVQKDSSLHAAYFYRALSFGNTGNFNLAVPDLAIATRLAPERDDYWVYLGMAYDLGAKDKANALVAFNKAISVNPKSKEGHFRRALLYYSIADDANACADFAKAVELGHSQAPNFKSKYCGNE